MQFSYAQTISLAVYAKAHVKRAKPPSFAKTSVMMHAHDISFPPQGATPDEWFANLAGATDVRLLKRDDEWTIEIVYPDESHYWRETDTGVYKRVDTAPSFAPPASVETARERLKSVLIDIHAFSAKNDCGNFTRIFADAIKTLDDAKIPSDWRRDYAPKGAMSGDAETLLASAMGAWVFGGMGSWNDLGFDGETHEEYERLSSALSDAINLAISTAVSA